LHERSIAHHPASPARSPASPASGRTGRRVRKAEDGETDLSAFLTTEPNVEAGAIQPKAMPVILVTPEEVETWMTASPDEALKLQSR
jgi:putative SOS response-associated peptidase YedK